MHSYLPVFLGLFEPFIRDFTRSKGEVSLFSISSGERFSGFIKHHHFSSLHRFIKLIFTKQIYKLIHPAYSKANRGGLYDLQTKRSSSQH